MRSEVSFVVTSLDGEVGIFATVAELEKNVEPIDVPSVRVFTSQGVEMEIVVDECHRDRKLAFIRWQSSFPCARVLLTTSESTDINHVRESLIRRIKLVDPEGDCRDDELSDVVARAERVLGFGFT